MVPRYEVRGGVHRVVAVEHLGPNPRQLAALNPQLARFAARKVLPEKPCGEEEEVPAQEIKIRRREAQRRQPQRYRPGALPCEGPEDAPLAPTGGKVGAR